MTESLTVAAVDLGAESGRVAAVHFDGERLELDIAHRFVTRNSAGTPGRLHWDFDGLWNDVRDGLAVVGDRVTVASVGVDTWGVDVGLLDASGRLVEQPTTYRDGRRVAAFERALREFGPDALYDATGTQLLEINTVFGLLADARERPEVLRKTALMLMMPDLFHHALAGSRVTEYSAATTTGFYDVAAHDWARGLLDRLGAPHHFLPEVVEAGTDVGPLLPELATGGLAGARVVLPPGHDTASAVLAVPYARPDTLFVSSGTWSLVGVVLDEPVITRESRLANLTNEGGYGGSVRFLRNVMGLWVLQECRRQWAREGVEVDYAQLVALAEAEPPLRSVVNLDAAEFLAPGDMPGRIRAYCRANGIPVPESMGQVARTLVDSLALGYRLVADDIERATGTPLAGISVVGGGARNALLQQATASATGLPVTCWSTEATALGNAASQLVALGELGGVDDVWRVVAASSEVRTHAPQTTDRWTEAAERLRDLVHAESRRRGLEEPTGAPTHEEHPTR